MYIAPSSGEPLPNFKRGFRLFSDVCSENAALYKRLMKIHSNPPILYYDFKPLFQALFSGVPLIQFSNSQLLSRHMVQLSCLFYAFHVPIILSIVIHFIVCLYSIIDMIFNELEITELN